MKPRLSDRKSMGISNHSPRTPKLYIYAIFAACRQTATSQPSKYKKNNKKTTINNICKAYQTLYLNCCLWLSLCCFMLFFVVLCCSMLFYVVEDLPTTQLFHSFHNIYLPKEDGDIQYQHNGQSQQIALSTTFIFIAPRLHNIHGTINYQRSHQQEE